MKHHTGLHNVLVIIAGKTRHVPAPSINMKNPSKLINIFVAVPSCFGYSIYSFKVAKAENITVCNDLNGMSNQTNMSAKQEASW